MRTIKFRARAFEKQWGYGIEKGDWVYGHYFVESIDIEDNITFQTQYFIKMLYGDHYVNIRIDKETLGQFTGLFDKNGKEVYEYMEIDNIYEVSFKMECYILTNISSGDIIALYNYMENKNGQVEITREYTKV